MESKEIIYEILIILTAAILLGFTVSVPTLSKVPASIIYFVIILALNITAKRIMAYHLEADIKINFWSWYQFWFTKRAHFKKPILMFWLPPLLALISKGYILWLAILEFDVKPNVARAAKRHGYYRYSDLTEYHITSIATAGVITTLALGIIGYITGFETFTRFTIYYSIWSLIPISKLDGSKILFGSKTLWFILLVVSIIMLLGTLTLI